MFDIAWSELMLIGGVALVVIGPKDLPKAMRTVGQAVGKIRRMAGEFQGQFNDAMREAELHDLKKQVEDVGGSVTSAMNSDYSSDFKPIEMPKDETPTSIGLDDAALKEAEAKLADLPLPEPLPPVDIAPADTAAPAVVEKPKRRRKAAAVEAEVSEPMAEAVAAPDDAVAPTAAEKPRRRSKVAAVEAEASEPVAEAVAAPADAVAPTAAEKPKRRNKVAAAEDEASELAAPAKAPRKRKAKIVDPDDGSAA